jgi:hypothetical protein
MRQSSLHLEFIELEGKVNYVVERIRGKEWSSSCPNCGGSPHQNGALPDRFRMFTKAHSKRGISIGWCRVCGYKWTSAKDYQPDPARIEEWRKEQITYHEQRKAESETALSHLRDENKWLVYYEALLDSPQAQGYWVGSGIDSQYYWHYWGLGFDPRHEFWFDTKDGWKQHITETATMAVRNINGEIVNIKHRLLEPFEGTKYRMEYTTHIEPLCIANLDNLVCDFAIICEGEKKNYVGWSLLDNVNVQAYGLPMTPSEEMLKSLQFKTAVYIPDPDALEERTNKNGKPLPPPANRIMETLKDRDVRILKLTDKLDDWILRTGASKHQFETLLKQARKV